jgi:cytoskeletal protein CcmA (bactofilin family)
VVFGGFIAKIWDKEFYMSNQSDSLESVVIGDGVVVKGTFTVPSKAIINGVIEGDLTAEEVLIGPTGKITGRVSAKVIDVRGQLHNTIISEKSLIVRSTGKIAGKVQYSEIEIEKGGEIEGTLSQGVDGPTLHLGGAASAV